MKKLFACLLAVLLCVGLFVPAAASASSEEYIKTDKTEYWEDEIFLVSYKFAQAASDSKRYINIYNSTTTFNDSTWIFPSSANKTSGTTASEWLTWSPNPGKVGKAGTYTMRVCTKDTHTAYPGYEDMTYTFTVKARTSGTTPATPQISVADTTLEVGAPLSIAYDGFSMTALNYDDMYSVSLSKKDGTELKRWYLWNCGSTYLGLYGTLEHTAALSAGEYDIKLETAYRDTPDNRTVKQTIALTVETPTITPAEGQIKTDKAEYWTDEIFVISYEFDKAIDSSLPKGQQRAINIYKEDTLVYLYVANGLQGSTSSEWLWCANPSLAGTPGTYTMKVVYRDTETPFLAHEQITATFTVKDRTQGTTPSAPAISLKDDTLSVGESLEIQFDGLSMTALSGDYVYTVHLCKADGTKIKSWIVWDCGTNYAGLFGELEYAETLPAGDYKVELEKNKNDQSYESMGKQTVTFTVSQVPSAPTGDGTLMVATVLLLAGLVVYVQMKRRVSL